MPAGKVIIVRISFPREDQDGLPHRRLQRSSSFRCVREYVLGTEAVLILKEKSQRGGQSWDQSTSHECQKIANIER